MAITQSDINGVIEKMENGDYTSYFFVPDFPKPSGGVKVIYDQVQIMNQNGFKAVIVHQKPGFKAPWLDEHYKKKDDGTYAHIPVVYLEQENLALKMEDFFFIPEGYPQLMENLAQQKAPCKKVVFCQNWYYVMNALQPGVTWDQLGINDVIVNCHTVGNYVKLLMPSMNIKVLTTAIDGDLFKVDDPIKSKHPFVAFQPSRDGGMKSSNVIKTFYALHPHFRWVQFKELVGMNYADFADSMKDSQFYVHFDEHCGWPTAPLEAFNAGCYVAAWDGVGSVDYLSSENCWLVQNGDILRLALAIGNMIEKWILDEIPNGLEAAMQAAIDRYTLDIEKDSAIATYNEYREDRIKELEQLIELIKKQEAKTNEG